MKRITIGMFAVACAAAVTLSAQTPPPPETQPAQPSAAKQSRAADENKVTVTGCLERSKDAASPTGTTGAAASADTSKFTLNNVTASPSASATAGTSGSARAAASSYRLDGDDSKLTPHVGHKVQITGTVENRASAMGASASASAPKLKVDAVTMIAASCTP